jgi:hypothetical protein
MIDLRQGRQPGVRGRPIQPAGPRPVRTVRGWLGVNTLAYVRAGGGPAAAGEGDPVDVTSRRVVRSVSPRSSSRPAGDRVLKRRQRSQLCFPFPSTDPSGTGRHHARQHTCTLSSERSRSSVFCVTVCVGAAGVSSCVRGADASRRTDRVVASAEKERAAGCGLWEVRPAVRVRRVRRYCTIFFTILYIFMLFLTNRSR